MSDELYLDYLKQSRERPAVLKMQLGYLRSECPDAIIFAFEGPDDKVVYGQWVRRIRDDLSYEPFLCNGKKGVRDLKNMIARDRTAMAGPIYFFVDRDFDGLNEFSDTNNVYCTDTYSFENQLVTLDVLESLLRDEFPCHGQPAVRKILCDAFDADYQKFLQVTKPTNFRLYLARTCGIKLSKPITNSLKNLAFVCVMDISPGEKKPSEIIVFDRQPIRKEVKGAFSEFKKLDGYLYYRGKFALKFFTAWLQELAAEHKDGKIGLFNKSNENYKVRVSEFTVSNFASKALIPNSFRDFILGIG